MSDYEDCPSCRVYRQTLADINRELIKLAAALHALGFELPGDVFTTANENDRRFREEGL